VEAGKMVRGGQYEVDNGNREGVGLRGGGGGMEGRKEEGPEREGERVES